METFDFRLRSKFGQILGGYRVEARILDTPVPEPVVAHQIIVIDRSGSMYYDMPSMREMLLKLLAVDEYKNARLRISVISYSSQGDVITHLCNVPIQEAMAGECQQEIRRLEATGLTCGSQALALAFEFVDTEPPEHLVAVTLHSDGWLNDPSPALEYRAVDELCARFSRLPSVVVNTIAHRESSDFKFLASVANRMGGTCVQARGVREVYDALEESTRRLAGKVAPTIQVPKAGDYQIFYSPKGRRLIGSDGELVVRGIVPDENPVLFTYHRQAGVVGDGNWDRNNVNAVVAFARAMVAEGRLQTAKQAIVETRDLGLKRHLRALTGPQVADLCAELDSALFDGYARTWANSFAGSDSLPVQTTCMVLDELARAGDLEVDLSRLHYRRRGLKRIQGSRAEDGTLVEPWLTARYRDGVTARLACFEYNRGNPTINMMLTRPIDLVPAAGGAPITTVAGIKLDLTDYRQYTVVGDGELNMDRVPLRARSKQAWRKVQELATPGLIPGAMPPFDPAVTVELDLAGRDLVDESVDLTPPPRAAIDTLLQAAAVQKLFTGLLEHRSERYTDEQLEELRAHYITRKLYLSFPTTTPYKDTAERDAMIDRGEIDFRTSYTVAFGTPDILHPGKLKSGNEFLRRWYAVGFRGRITPEDFAPTLDDWWDPAFSISHKKLGPRVKITAIDILMARVFDGFFGASSESRADLLGLLDLLLPKGMVESLNPLLARELDLDTAVERLIAASVALNRAVDEYYTLNIVPLAFYVGAAGALPDSFGDIQALDADALKACYPQAPVAKAEQEASFFLLPEGVVMTVFQESVPYSVSR